MATPSQRDDVAQAGRQVAERLVDLTPWLQGWGLVPVRRDADATGKGGIDDVLVDDRHYRCPSTETLILNAQRVRLARQELLDMGSLSTKDLAAARDCSLNTVHKQIQRACKRDELIAVTVSGEIRVPAVLLDDALDVRPAWQPVISVLKEARLSDWAIWGWIARPNAGLSGQVAADVIDADPERVYAAAHRRMVQATS